METFKDENKWAANEFGILESEVKSHHSGICYNRIHVTTKDAANKVSNQVKERYVNGGGLDGMRLGNITRIEGGFSIMC